ncbi:MAG: methyltransferase domain-containing protein [Eubacteriales bacterium]|nr:methyltransferase domain-containing protein [Eubacteriales bacterium]
MAEIFFKKNINGSILDVGGGGEGIIGRVYGRQVTAIDKLQSELDEVTCDCEKLVMDACDLDFADQSFDNVTFFYTFMFMEQTEWQQALAEANRVLKVSGKLFIWDAVIESAYPEPFLVDVLVNCVGEEVKTTYGVGKLEAKQNAQTFVDLAMDVGLKLVRCSEDSGQFFLQFERVGQSR